MANDKAVAEALGARLAQARIAAELTQPAVAAALTHGGIDTHKATVSAWEKGRNVPNALVLRKLARLYRVSGDLLLWGMASPVNEEVQMLDDLRTIATINPETYNKLRTQLSQAADALRSTDTLLREHGASGYVTPARAAAQLGRSPTAASAPAPYSFVGGMSNFGELDDVPTPKPKAMPKKREAK